MRLVFVHAHPDDESLWTGLAIAHHAARGDDVHVLTCTLGEEGEVIPEDLRHLELPAGRPRDARTPDLLADVRRDELHSAVKELGVSSVTVLADGRYRDSGMAGTPSAAHPRAFTGAATAQSSQDVAAYLRELRPDVVVTYDAHGGYGHPDHIRTHEATRAAVAGLAQSPAFYTVVSPRSWVVEDRGWLSQHATAPGVVVPAPEDAFLPSVVDDALVTHTVIDEEALVAQTAALRRHRTQVTVFDGYYTLSNDVATRLAAREAFVRLDPVTGASLPVVTEGLRHTGLMA
ncbi:N-acetyl-1-D-myo-inositol-2-amino-2-deoxy-alpha-D-glucopyranoside deacetylase [Flexivirga oryzae]|uniref:N-acetyl-1-D-myo-inositol-2-amino-2-deoxy-alpha-D-glucopyranoside deacetylase n=1 Tax=Flexivirga oryzae TaxID=1794944 RepID=A0A839N9H3_9MICO|nr:N-acetyl-1-D-myo-inositol-2-amino-2-deoxy-alpha-D-glucopyranoside deacetylase [Flexivirga oryzae]MBB2894428.1 N-acetyl-1-D-myo-inositol-2-amino-2-deoxy-alpha-D-glucopyranoside deacetylase [Flexivirga oryzae]